MLPILNPLIRGVPAFNVSTKSTLSFPSLRKRRRSLPSFLSSSIEDLTTYYTAKVNYETGIPTPMEFIYYYVDKIKKMI